MAASPRTLVDLIRALRDAAPNRGIHFFGSRFEERFVPYGELFRQAVAFASSLRDRGVGRSDRVLLPLSSNPETVAAFWGLVLLGAVPFSVPVPLMAQDRQAYLRRLVHLATACAVRWWILPGEAGQQEDVPEGFPPERILRLGPLSRLPLPSKDRDDFSPASPDDMAFVQFSSGSTSHPKGVPITHRALVYNLSLIVDNDRRTPESVFASWLPLYHDMGLVGGLLSNLWFRNRLVLMDPRCFVSRPLAWLEAISRFRATVTAIPNFALDVCTQRVSEEQLRQAGVELGSLRYVYNGSEPVRPSSIRRFEQKFASFGFVPGSIYPAYGMAEATLIVTAPKYGVPVVIRRFRGAEIPSVGYPLGDFQVAVRDEEGRPCGAEQVGEIFLRGTSVTPGYVGPGAESGDLLRDGWLATGDLGFLDEEGRLFVTGRKKDLLIVRGQNFYGHDIAASVEEGLSLRPGTVHVFSVEREEAEAVVLLVAAPRAGGPARGSRPDGDPDLEGLRREIVKLVLREFGLAVHDVLFVPRLPKTTSGKIMRHECERIYRERRG